MTKKLVFVLLSLALVALVSCSQSQIITTTETAITAVEVALPIVASSIGISPTLLVELTNYLQAASTALGKVSDILATGGTAASISAQITAVLTGIVNQDSVIQQQISGLPSVIIQAIHAVAVDLEAILTQYGSAPGTPGNMAAKAPTGEYHFTGTDLLRLRVDHLRTENLSNSAVSIRNERRAR